MVQNLLTARDLADARDPKKCKPGKLHDGNGLYLDVRSATSASWLYKFTLAGVSDEVGLGSFKKVDEVEARRLRDWCIDEVNAKRNPKETRKADKRELVRAAAAPKPQAIGVLVREHFELITKGAVTTDAGRKDWINSMQEPVIGKLAKMLPHHVTSEDVVPFLEAYYAKAPVRATDIRQRLAKVLSWARARDKANRLFAWDWKNPVKWEDNLEHDLDRGEKYRAGEKHHAALPSADVNAFLVKVEAADEYMATLRAALAWHVLSVTRIGETTGARWEELDLRRRAWVIPAARTKMRRDHHVALTDQHFAILDRMAGGTEYPVSGLIFPGRKVGDPVSITGVRKLMHNCWGHDQTLHGFRGTFATWAREQMDTVTLSNGRTKQILLYEERLVEESLAHVVGNEVRNAYVDSVFLEQRRGLLEDWALYCVTARKAEDQKVVEFRTRKAA